MINSDHADNLREFHLAMYEDSAESELTMAADYIDGIEDEVDDILEVLYSGKIREAVNRLRAMRGIKTIEAEEDEQDRKAKQEEQEYPEPA